MIDDVVRIYSVTLFTGPAIIGQEVYQYSNWIEIAGILSRLVASPKGTAVVNSIQLDQRKNAHKFGRISWSTKGHERWTHNSPGGEPLNQLDFYSTTVWCPSHQSCERFDCDPDTFIEIYRYKFKCDFQAMIIASALDQVCPLSDNEKDRIAKQFNANLVQSKNRPWAYESTLGDHCLLINCIQDLLHTQISEDLLSGALGKASVL